MPELEIGLAILAFVLFGVFLTVMAQQLPRLWKWFKFKIWKDLNYAQGYRKGFADGERNERQWRDLS